jgi:hypothetical protein
MRRGGVPGCRRNRFADPRKSPLISKRVDRAVCEIKRLSSQTNGTLSGELTIFMVQPRRVYSSIDTLQNACGKSISDLPHTEERAWTRCAFSRCSGFLSGAKDAIRRHHLSRAWERSAEGAQPRPATSVNIGSTGQPV